jgi:hypothetical protein
MSCHLASFSREDTQAPVLRHIIKHEVYIYHMKGAFGVFRMSANDRIDDSDKPRNVLPKCMKSLIH